MIDKFSKKLALLCKSCDIPEPIFNTMTLATGYGAIVNFHTGIAATAINHDTEESALEDVAEQAFLKLGGKDTVGLDKGRQIHS